MGDEHGCGNVFSFVLAEHKEFFIVSSIVFSFHIHFYVIASLLVILCWLHKARLLIGNSFLPFPFPFLYISVLLGRFGSFLLLFTSFWLERSSIGCSVIFFWGFILLRQS